MPINLPNCVAEEIHSALTHDADHGDLPSTTTYQILQTCLVKNLQLRIVGRRLADASTDPVAEDQVEHVVTQLTHIIIGSEKFRDSCFFSSSLIYDHPPPLLSSDCSSIPYVDLMGKDALAQTYADYETIDITVLMANCKVAVRQLFETTDFYQKVPKNRMFVNVNDAVTQALKEQRSRFPERNITIEASDPRQKPKDPVALSPAQRTVISNVLNEDREEQTTQSAASVTLSTQRGDLSVTVKKGSAKVKKATNPKTDKKKKEEVPPKKEEKKKEEVKRVPRFSLFGYAVQT
ncbi:unnamed protein product [Heligmosomoides polygyrus]|uniref:STAS domain-containing protein n=1 Tax=Heligmosomoides polygyrus TaxID=6339 RepID=A0A183GG72_HELPZ|nr:unnamed protein product [Heligmosomoides polygyrus]